VGNLNLQDTNWIIIITIFTASFSLAWFTSRWIAAKMPGFARFGFFLFLASITLYFCVITLLMQDILQR
jgi:hypothetical protein